MASLNGGQITAVVAANKFGVDFQEALNKMEKGNLLFSPCSISVALAMISTGARENTAAELSKVLHWDTIPPQALHSQMKTLIESISDENDKNIELEMASRMFIRKDFGLSQAFREATVKYYGVEEGIMDYKHDVAGARREVNSWVAQKTREDAKILPINKSAFDSKTKLTLVNTAYLKATWLSGAWIMLPHTSRFIVKRGKAVNIQMITQRARLRYRLANELGSCGCQILEMPLSKPNFSVFFLLPFVKSALGDLEMSLTHHKLQRVLDLTEAGTPCDIQVEIPANLQMVQELHLKEVLLALGVKDMFKDGSADLSKIHQGKGCLHMNNMIHRTFADISPQLGETENYQDAEEIGSEERTVEPEKFHANRPFLFFVRHKCSGAILFAGRMVNPVPHCETAGGKTSQTTCVLI